ncbi:MAG: DUF2750 domain-containing protein [Proteobacteria bacterium]|nr:DUF2750 domain-containing protein [Pseudomonadota bacterium]
MLGTINNKEIEAVIKLSPAKRYEYFLKRVADRAFIWGLYDNGWVSAADNAGNFFFPIWPAKEYAELCIENYWKAAFPKNIEIHEFLDDYLDEMKKTKIFIAVFYTPNDKGIILDSEQLKKDLLRELDRIE